MSDRFLVLAAFVALIAVGCSKGQQASVPQGGAVPSAAPTNPTGLPLPEGAVVVESHAFRQTIDRPQQSGSPLDTLGKGTYAGQEVVASSTASDQELAKWLAQVALQPPQGYKSVDGGGKTVHDTARKYGIDYVAFVSLGADKSGATIVVMDPKLLAKLGPVLNALDKYNSLPEPMRQAMDQQIRQRTGVSVSELTDKSAPLGVAIAAANEFRGSDKRAIILVSAEKSR